MSTPPIPDPSDLLSDDLASATRSAGNPGTPGIPGNRVMGRDFTRPIMGRLGYMRVSPAVARRRRIQRTLRRTAWIAGFAMLVVVGAFIHDHSPGARRPEGLTLPHALDRDMKGQQLQFQRTIQTIRGLPTRFVLPESPAGPVSPSEPVETDPPKLHEDVDRSAIGPMRWL